MGVARAQGVARMPGYIKWMCLRCWEDLEKKPGEIPPTMYLNGPCEECGTEKVPVTNVRKDSN